MTPLLTTMENRKLLKIVILCVISIQFLFVFIPILHDCYSTKFSTPLFMANTSSDILISYIKMKIEENMKNEFLNHNSNETHAAKILDEIFIDENITDGIHNDSTKFESRNLNISIGVKQKRTFRLGEFIPSNQSINILIVTRSRSGSSVLGDLINQNPGTFYTFEPLAISDDFGTMSLSDREKVDLIKNVFKCTTNEEFIKFEVLWKFGFDHNFRFKSGCENVLEGNEACFLQDVYKSSCHLFPIRLIKTIRLSFEDVESILLDKEIGESLKVIFLFRDPRGRIQSLKYVTEWCRDENNLCDVTNLCRDLDLQIQEALRLKEKYSDQVYLMRYEDICRNGQRETNKLQNFLDLKTTPSIEEFIVNEFVPSKAFNWKNNIFQNDISEVQTHCFESMKYLGYNPIVTSIKGLINRQDDLLGYPLFDML